MEEVAGNITVPAVFEFKPSATDKLKIGVWAKSVIKKDELYGPFVGEKKKLAEVLDGTYSWEIRGPKGRRIYTIDASDPSKGNWMRYVKTARYFDQQNMTAIQKDKQIFYKTLKKISKGEELLCWYKEERPVSDPKVGKTKSKESKEAPDIKSKQDAVDKKNTFNDETNHAKDNSTSKKADIEYDIKGSSAVSEDICKTTSSKTAKDTAVVDTSSVHGACINLSGLSDSIQKVIATTTSSATDIRNREPVVRLVPLSAEIKLKVHLDLDIRLDADLRMKSCREDSKKGECPVSSKLEFYSDDYCNELTKADHIEKPEIQSAILLKEKEISTPVTYVKGVSIKQEKTCTDISIKEEKRSVIVKEEKKNGIDNSEVKEEKKNGIDDPEVNVSSTLYGHTEKEQPESKSEDAIFSVDTTDARLNELKPDAGADEIKSLKMVEKTDAQDQEKEKSDQNVHDDLKSHDTNVCKDSHSENNRDTSHPYAIDRDNGSNTNSKPIEVNVPDEGLVAKSKCEDIIKEQCNVNDKGNDSKIESTCTSSIDSSSNVISTATKVENHDLVVKAENVPGSSKETKVKLMKKKKKTFGCKICNREFRKPFHLKMHIIRTHEKRERKFRQYIISKREIIRTRSKSYLEEAKRRSLLDQSRPRDNQPSNQVLDTSVPSNEHTDTINDLSIRSPLPSQDAKFYSSDLERTYSKVSQFPNTPMELHECHRCQRKFQYKSWLNRHLVYHQKQDLIVQQRSKVPMDKWRQLKVVKKESDSSKTPNKITILFGQKSSVSVLPKERPYSCSECGKQFTTKKNCRRHRRLIHNILVRPERTKLHYTNYTVEKSVDDIDGKSLDVSKDEVRVDKSLKLETKLLNRWKAEAKARKIPAVDSSTSTGIAVRLFDPSRLTLPEKANQSPTKIQWGVSSNRTGPPPASRSPDNRNAYQKMFDQEAVLKYASDVTNPWTSRKPSPFIPKKNVVETKGKIDEKKASHAVLKPTNLTAVQKPADLIVPMVSKKQDIPINRSSQNINYQRLKRPVDLSSISTASVQDTRILKSSPIQLIHQAPTLIHHRDIPTAHAQNQVLAKSPEKHVIKQERSILIPTLKRKLELKQAHGKVQRQNELLPPKLVPILPQTQYANPRSPPLLSIPSVIQKPRPAACSDPNPKLHSPPKKDTMETVKTTKKTFACNVCNMVFATFHQVNQHVSFHADQFPFKCEICAKLFQVPQELVYHRNTHASVTQTQTVSSKICNKDFPTTKLLEEHTKTLFHIQPLPKISRELGQKSPNLPRPSGEISQNLPRPSGEISQNLPRPSVEISQKCQDLPKLSVEILHPKLTPAETPRAATTYKCTKCSREFQETAPFHSHIIDCALSGM